MEIKAHEIFKLVVDRDLESKVVIVEVYEVLQCREGHALARLIRVDREDITQCPHCGKWHRGDDIPFTQDGVEVAGEVV